MRMRTGVVGRRAAMIAAPGEQWRRLPPVPDQTVKVPIQYGSSG